MLYSLKVDSLMIPAAFSMSHDVNVLGRDFLRVTDSGDISFMNPHGSIT